VLACDDVYYVLKFDREAVSNAIAAGMHWVKLPARVHFLL
jgi:hypothetical protein